MILRTSKTTNEVQNGSYHIRKQRGRRICLQYWRIDEKISTVNRWTDGRKARGKRYPLPILLTLILLAKLAGEDTPKRIAEWLRLRRRQIIIAFQLERKTVRGTIPKGKTKGVHLLAAYLSEESMMLIQIAVDGKRMKSKRLRAYWPHWI
jgi:hypothetical protein